MAQAALAFERLWSAFYGPVVVLALFAAAVISGLPLMLPDWLRLAFMVVSGLAFVWSLRPLFRISWPPRYEAMRRVEARSELTHRPVSAVADQLANGTGDQIQELIWEEHKLRQLRDLENLKAGAPQSAWRDLDPRALRVPAAIALVAAIFLGPGDPKGSLADSLRFMPQTQAIPLVMDAWLKPPGYTGKPPMLLTSPAMLERLATDPEILIPESSTLTLRVAGAKQPKLTFHELVEADAEAKVLPGIVSKTRNDDGQLQSETVITRPVLVKITDGDREIANWRISTIPDAPPSIEITENPSGDSSGTLTAKWKAGDDYGVTRITSDIYLADEQDDGIGFSGNGIFQFEPPKLPVSLRKASPKEEIGTTKGDMAEHPWAGFMVEMTLTAIDAAGNSTESQIRTFRLPERMFIKPLARALIEQRRNLILEPEKSGHVVQMLDAILTYPEGLIQGSGTHIAIAAVKSRLGAAEGQDDVDTAISMLWQIAVGIEEGSMANAKAELEALRKELERALRDGASPERIAELMDKLRQAMDRYTQSLMEETQRRLSQGNPEQNQQQQGRMISPEDLKKMLDMIEKLAQSGANEAAQEMLSQLEDILRNLQPGMNAQQMAPQRDSQMGKMLDQLSELMRQQQQLMDDTQRMQPGGEDNDGDRQQGKSQGEMGDRQRGLGDMLQQLVDQFGKNGMKAPRSFGDAGQSMQGAEGSLRKGDRDSALGDQGDAMAKLRDGAQGLARQMMQQGQGQQGNEGRHGEARGDDRDPLGRPMPQRGDDYGPNDNMLPSELAIQRAREILDMLRSRAGDAELPRLERDYIERLLRGLY